MQANLYSLDVQLREQERQRTRVVNEERHLLAHNRDAAASTSVLSSCCPYIMRALCALRP